MSEDFNVVCPKCKSTIFKETDTIVLRSIKSKMAGKSYIYPLKLYECMNCNNHLYLLDGQVVFTDEA